MHELMQLKEMLMKELSEYGAKGELSGGSLEVVDKLAHAIKNLCKIIEAYEEEEEYSQRGYAYAGNSMDGGNRYSRQGGASYARGRGRYANRDAQGRYSRGGDFVAQLEELMQEAPSDPIRQGIQQLIQQADRL